MLKRMRVLCMAVLMCGSGAAWAWLGESDQERQKTSRIDLSSLPYELAIKEVRGDGSRRVAHFAGPLCDDCQDMRKALLAQNNITLYTFILPIDSMHARDLTESIWCAPDRAKVWQDVMKGAEKLRRYQCDWPERELYNLSNSLAIIQLPTTIFEDGKRTLGPMTKQQISTRLNQAGPAKKR